MPKYIVSACLAGRACRYSGKDALCPAVAALVERGEAVAVCPEELGGFPTPRDPAEQRGDRVVTSNGEDVTETFVAGARAALGVAQKSGCTHAILKSKSPSCGVGRVYDGSFTGTLVDGDGVFAQALHREGIPCTTSEAFVARRTST